MSNNSNDAPHYYFNYFQQPFILCSFHSIRAVKKSLSSLTHSFSAGSDTGLLGNSVILVVHIQKEGFTVFVNNHFCVFFGHRRNIEYYDSLTFTLPVLDDNGNQEQAVFHKIWWGITDPSLPFHEVPASALALVSTYVPQLIMILVFFCFSKFNYRFSLFLPS